MSILKKRLSKSSLDLGTCNLLLFLKLKNLKGSRTDDTEKDVSGCGKVPRHV